jgi:hypothetical protein
MDKHLSHRSLSNYCRFHNTLDYLIVSLLAAYLLIGFVYVIRYDEIILNLTNGRNFLIGLLIVALTLRVFSEGKKDFVLILSACLMLVGVIVNFAAERTGSMLAVKACIQIQFAYLLVQYCCNNHKFILLQISNLRSLILPILLLAWGGVLGSLLDQKILVNYLDGFNGNRVNLSISLGQLSGLLFLYAIGYSKKDGKKLDEPLIFGAFLGIIATQIVTGGRAGLLLTTILYFILTIKSRENVPTKVCLFIITFFVVRYFLMQAGIPKIDGYAYTDIARIHPDVQAHLSSGLINLINTNDHIAIWNKLIFSLDQISSYRISIFLNAIRSLTLEDLILGRGANNFVVYLNGAIYEPHVVLLNQLGSFGFIYVLGSLIFFAKLLLKIYHNSNIFTLYCLPFVGISFLQPALFHTQISTSVLFFIGAGIIYSGATYSGSLQR